MTSYATLALPGLISPEDRNTSYGTGIEAIGVQREIGDFDYQSSPAFKAVLRHYGHTIRLCELKALVYTATFWLHKRRGITLPKLSRNAKRNLALLIKYIQTHYDHIVPVFSMMSLCTQEKVQLPLLDAEIYSENQIS
jgi:hypothetical protein